MTLTDLLVDSGMTRQDLADRLEISLSTAKRLKDIDDEILAAVDAFVTEALAKSAADEPPRKEPASYTDDDIQALLKRRGVGESDHNIAHSVGLKVHELNKLIHNHAVAGCNARLGRCCHSPIPDYNHQTKDRAQAQD